MMVVFDSVVLPSAAVILLKHLVRVYSSLILVLDQRGRDLTAVVAHLQQRLGLLLLLFRSVSGAALPFVGNAW